MLTRIYIGIWLLMGLLTLIVFLTGYLNAFVIIGFGIAFQALVFIGMIAVVPSMVGQKQTKTFSGRAFSRIFTKLFNFKKIHIGESRKL